VVDQVGMEPIDPAGTGVWVVNTWPAIAASRASAKVSWPSCINNRCAPAPGGRVAFIHVTHSGAQALQLEGADAAMPSRISWRIRMSLSPSVQLVG